MIFMLFPFQMNRQSYQETGKGQLVESSLKKMLAFTPRANHPQRSVETKDYYQEVRMLRIPCVGKQVLMILLLAMLCKGADAWEFKGFDIHGYGSVGYLHSDRNNYLTADTADGTFEAYDFGLTIGRTLTPELRISGQGVVRNLGRMGKGIPRIDWANIDYRPRNEFGIRVGIIRQPVGMYNQARDLDMLRTTALLPQGVYNEQLRDWLTGQPGAQVYGNYLTERAGMFGYSLSLAQTRYYDDSKPWGDNFVDGILLNMGLQQAGNPNAFPGDGYDYSDRYTIVGALTWDTPLDGLRLQASVMHQRAEIEIRTQNPDLPAFDLDMDVNKYLILSAEYTYNAWQFAFEYLYTDWDVTVDLPGAETMTRKFGGYYVQAKRRMNDWLELATYYSVYHPDLDDRKGRAYEQLSEALGQPGMFPDYMAWQKDFCVAVRFDITPDWLFKMEWHYIDGVGQLYPAANPDGFSRYWNLFALKTTYTF
jgi:hypothetical protein